MAICPIQPVDKNAPDGVTTEILQDAVTTEIPHDAITTEILYDAVTTEILHDADTTEILQDAAILLEAKAADYYALYETQDGNETADNQNETNYLDSVDYAAMHSYESADQSNNYLLQLTQNELNPSQVTMLNASLWQGLTSFRDLLREYFMCNLILQTILILLLYNFRMN